MNDAVISASGLRKAFGDLVAVDGIDFDVRRGEAFGFLGPNGAGKTSTMRMIGCVSPPSGGGLDMFGLDPRRDGRAIRSRIGVVPQTDQLDSELTVLENLIIYARYFDISRAEARRRAAELLDFVQLGERADSPVEPLSGGQKRRVSIARSLINDPDLLILDEPTTGLDPQARHVLWDRLYQLKEQGRTLVLTTHYMDEAEQLCDRLVVMDGGRIVAEGSPTELITTYATNIATLPEWNELKDLVLIVEHPEDHEEFAAVLKRAMSIPDSELARMGGKAARIANRSLWENLIHEYLEFVDHRYRAGLGR